MSKHLQAYMTRSDRKFYIARYMLGEGGWFSALKIARAFGIAKSPHLLGILDEMQQAGMIVSELHPHMNGGYVREFHVTPEYAADVDNLELPF